MGNSWWIYIFNNWPQCPSTEVEVVVVVTVRCLRWDWSMMEVSREASDAVLLSWTTLLLLLLTGVLTAEKERVFLGVAAWLRDKDRPAELDCCFLLRRVLREERQENIKSFVACIRVWHVETTREICSRASSPIPSLDTHTLSSVYSQGTT